MPRRPLNFSTSSNAQNQARQAHQPAILPAKDESRTTGKPLEGLSGVAMSSDGLSREGVSREGLTLAELERYAEEYLLDCDYRMQSPRTISTRRVFIQRLLWFLRHRSYAVCGTYELRQFFRYLAHGHEEPGGRWSSGQEGERRDVRYLRPVRPITIRDYHVNFQCLFNWMVAEELIAVSPLSRIPKPPLREEQVQPFTPQQIAAILQAARRSLHPLRDEAIVWFLLDTGCRASELCTLTMADLDLQGRHAHVLGKGNKRRTVFFGRNAGRALSLYLRNSSREAEDPVFQSAHGPTSGQPLNRDSLRLLIRRLGHMAGIKAAKVSPHVFRHTCAIEMLRNGCDVFSLKEILGHSSLTICQSYLRISQADVENQHRRYSPGDSLALKKRG